jgi:hypothetical protein
MKFAINNYNPKCVCLIIKQPNRYSDVHYEYPICLTLNIVRFTINNTGSTTRHNRHVFNIKIYLFQIAQSITCRPTEPRARQVHIN